MNIKKISSRYTVKILDEEDIVDVYNLCRHNEQYYRYCPPFVTEESKKNDMIACPPGKTLSDKYYVGYYDGDKLLAVLDLILDFPNERTALIGFFMMDLKCQNKGLGSSIVSELSEALRKEKIDAIQLAWVQANPQPESFWHKNGFIETGDISHMDNYTVVIAQKNLRSN